MPRRTSYQPGVPCWVDCITPDLTGAQRFYGALFGWEFTDEGGSYRLASLDGELIGGLGTAPPGRWSGAAWNVYLATKDADRTRADVEDRGGTVVMGPVPAGEDGRLFLAVDPQGAPVGFWEGHHAQGVVLADEAGAVCGHDLVVPRADAAERFYGGLFGFSTGGHQADGADGEEGEEGEDGEDGEHRLTLDLDGTAWARLVEDPAAQPGWVPYIGVHDLAAAEADALAAGARLLGRPTRSRTVLRDPWGAVFGMTRPSVPV
ncbi:VOC family protein [Streptomyces sp. NBC_00160]|uniref:VOC family protein n=1 Tax=Streptomyces TaxID=1883 RepID=UPI002257C62F|nr:VOC family protein [Streptomyces sp. NBC_00160]MCX5304635.1 VOC family protein [Streptomyces sp. NBC_00160]